MTVKPARITEQPTLQGVLDALEPLIQLRVPDITFERTTKALQLAGSPPRIVWAPGSGGSKAVDSPGGNPRIVIVRSAGLQVYCWGDDWGTTERLSSIAISVMQVACNGSIDWQADPWPLESENMANWLTEGNLNVLACTIDIPIFELPERPILSKPTPVLTGLQVT